MTSVTTFEYDVLRSAYDRLKTYASRFGGREDEAKLQLLEAVASQLGGFWLEAYQAEFGFKPIASTSELSETANELISLVRRTQVHPSLALCALAREEISESKQKTTGAYHTDFRLATRVAQLAATHAKVGSKVVDPACGAGILLVALAIECCGSDRRKMARWLTENVCAVDLSETSLRATLLSLSSLTSDLSVVAAMRKRCIVGDSLLMPDSKWTALAPSGFDLVIGNPPWEKLKVLKHEFLKSQGKDRNYGADTETIDDPKLAHAKSGMENYVGKLSERYTCMGHGEPDLFVAFTELFGKLCRPGGHVAALLPAGLIRSKGTEPLRKKLIGDSRNISISVIDNRARFFAIDRRFKFLAVSYSKRKTNAAAGGKIKLLHEKRNDSSVEAMGSVVISKSTLETIRPDLSLPEVRDSSEWAVFRRIAASGVSWSDEKWGWRAKFCREVDMTRERPLFVTDQNRKDGWLPVIEGRMVQQHRLGAKAYKSGTGRRAVWETIALGDSRIASQFCIRREDIPVAGRNRTDKLRGGFCDITGQTNERSMLAALIPPNFICGNKVPTVIFPDDSSEERLLAWSAVMNSFVIDWMLRRVITTTINYFLLVSVPMPRLVRDGLPWRRIVTAAMELRALDCAGASRTVLVEAAKLRALIDVEVAHAYGLSLKDMVTIMGDFLLLDRGQEPIEGEARSTITRDLVLTTMAEKIREDGSKWAERLEAAPKTALAYVPSEFASETEDSEGGIQNAKGA